VVAGPVVLLVPDVRVSDPPFVQTFRQEPPAALYWYTRPVWVRAAAELL
jgi:hypothetical protein